MPIIDTRSIIKGAGVLVIALAWNEAAKKFIDWIFPLETEDAKKAAMVATVTYAIFVTILIIIIIAVYNYTTIRVNSDNFTKRQIRKINRRSKKN